MSSPAAEPTALPADPASGAASGVCDEPVSCNMDDSAVLEGELRSWALAVLREADDSNLPGPIDPFEAAGSGSRWDLCDLLEKAGARRSEDTVLPAKFWGDLPRVHTAVFDYGLITVRAARKFHRMNLHLGTQVEAAAVWVHKICSSMDAGTRICMPPEIRLGMYVLARKAMSAWA